MFEIDEETLRTRPPRDYYVNPEERKWISERVAQDGFVRDAEVLLKRGTNSEFWASMTLMPFEFSGEDASLAWYHDITERKRAADVQREILEAIPCRLVVSNADTGELLYVNELARTAYGIETGGGRITSAYKNPEDRQELVARLRRDGRVDDFEAELYSADGTPEWILVSARVMDFEGQRAALTVSQVITARKHAEQELVEKEGQLRVALENMPGGICYTDKDRNYIFFNSQYSELYGFPEGLLSRSEITSVWRISTRRSAAISAMAIPKC